MQLKKSAYPNPPTRELRLGHDETSEKVHEAIERSRNDGSHHEVGGHRHTGHAIVGEVQQGQEHEQEEPEELGCSTPKARLGWGSLTAGPTHKKQDQMASSAVRLQAKDTGKPGTREEPGCSPPKTRSSDVFPRKQVQQTEAGKGA